jgi:hypothetical protein
VPLVLRNARGPEPEQDRDDDTDDAQAPPKHLKLPWPVMLCRFQHGRRGPTSVRAEGPYLPPPLIPDASATPGLLLTRSLALPRVRSGDQAPAESRSSSTSTATSSLRGHVNSGTKLSMGYFAVGSECKKKL